MLFYHIISHLFHIIYAKLLKNCCILEIIYIYLVSDTILPEGRQIKKITIDIIAKEAKVSKASVSRVLNKKNYISEEMHQRIQSVIDKYEFTPSVSARSIKNGPRTRSRSSHYRRTSRMRMAIITSFSTLSPSLTSNSPNMDSTQSSNLSQTQMNPNRSSRISKLSSIPGASLPS